MLSSIKINFYRLIRKVKSQKGNFNSFLYWFPFILQDRHYDYYFIFALLKKKLEGVYKDLELNKDSQAGNVLYCIDLIKKLENENNYNFIDGDYEKMNDTRLLFNIIRDNILTWWT